MYLYPSEMSVNPLYLGFHDSKQSSAKNLISETMSVEISLMYKENSNGPRTVPCVTPDTTGAH